jgi:hypothetical protein
MSLPKKPRTRVYVVARYDPRAAEPHLQFTAEAVVESAELAQAEVERLATRSAGSEVRYFVQPARLHQPSAAAGTVAPKVAGIRRVLEELRARLGAATFDVVDHWPADPYAVAVAARATPSRLAYLSAYEKPAGRFDVHLERLPDPAAGVSYTDVGYVTDLDVDGVAAVVARHLAERRSRVAR